MEMMNMAFSPSQGLAERGFGPIAQAMGSLYHTHSLLPNQCASFVVQAIKAPLPLVWSMVRRFDKPQSYKRFVRDCTMYLGNGGVGSVREVIIASGLPAETSLERLDKLDDAMHVMRISFIGGDHRLFNYRSTITLHEDEEDGVRKTVVIESYVVDVPDANNEEETCFFVNTIIGFNLKALAEITQSVALWANNYV